MADRRDEKFDEKEMEKREEKSPEEKNWDEKWRRDPLGAVVWAGILIWAGLALLAENVGLLEQVRQQVPLLADLGVWSLIFLGAGLIVVLEVVVRSLVPAYRRPVSGTLVLAFILIGLGSAGIFGWELTWPLILIAVGLLVLLRGFFRRGF